MIIRKLRLQKAWSQEQLAEICGLSIRTIQRIERGQKASLESLKSIAAVLDVDLKILNERTAMNTEKNISYEEQQAIEYVRDIKGFYSHLITYILVMLVLLILNIYSSSHGWWVMWPALGWGIGVFTHGASVFEYFSFFGPEWEKRQIEKKLGKKL